MVISLLGRSSSKMNKSEQYDSGGLVMTIVVDSVVRLLEPPSGVAGGAENCDELGVSTPL